MPGLGLERMGRERNVPGFGVRAPVAARARGGAAGAGAAASGAQLMWTRALERRLRCVPGRLQERGGAGEA